MVDNYVIISQCAKQNFCIIYSSFICHLIAVCGTSLEVLIKHHKRLRASEKIMNFSLELQEYSGVP